MGAKDVEFCSGYLIKNEKYSHRSQVTQIVIRGICEICGILFVINVEEYHIPLKVRCFFFFVPF